MKAHRRTALSPKRTFLGALAAVLVLTAVGFVAPAAARTIAVVEVRVRGQEVGDPTAVADRLGRLVAPTGRLDLLDPKVALARFRRTVVVPPQHERVKRLEEIYADIRRGDDLLYTDPSKAVPVLDAARQELQKILSQPTVDAEVNEILFQTQMLLARSHVDSGNAAAAREVMEDIIQQFGERGDVTEERHHPNIVRLYQQTQRQLARRRTGSVMVSSVDGEPLEIILNRRLVQDDSGTAAKTPFVIENLLPGNYHVQLRRTQEDVSKIHRVVVPDKGRATLDVDMRFDQVLTIRERSVGLSFNDLDEMQKSLIDYASRVGEILDVEEVLAVALLPHFQRAALRAHRIDVAARRPIESTDIPVDGQVVQDAQYLQATQILCGLDAPPPAAVALLGGAAPGEPTPWYKDWIGWTLVGAGVASVGVASYFLVDFLDKRDCAADIGCAPLQQRIIKAADAKTSRNVSYALYGVGGAAITAGVLVFILRDRTPSQPATVSGWPAARRPMLVPFAGADGGGLLFSSSF